MSTYAALRVHVIFATKHRVPTLEGEWRGQLHAFVGGCLKTLECVPEAIGGTEDHVHLLISMRTKHAPADIVREVKKVSTGWIRDEQGARDFSWQEGYAAISVSPSEKPMICQYIVNQEKHHREESALEELRRLLKEAEIEYDPTYFN